MNKVLKRSISVMLIMVMLITTAGCSLFDSKAKVYSRYAISLLDINYKNNSKDYMTLTGVSSKDAEAVYVSNMDYQAHNLMNYYGVKEVDDGTLVSQFYYLAQEIYGNAKYEVTDVKKDEAGKYTLELTVYPLDTLDVAYDEIVKYIENFNARVDDGDFNNTTEVDYEAEFAGGIIEILKKKAQNPTYREPVVLEIPIQPSNDYYYISDDDFLKINDSILYIRETVQSTEAATEAASEEAATEAAQ